MSVFTVACDGGREATPTLPFDCFRSTSETEGVITDTQGKCLVKRGAYSYVLVPKDPVDAVRVIINIAGHMSTTRF